MKKLFLREYDYPVHLTTNGAGSDEKINYRDELNLPMKKLQRFLTENTGSEL